jgi:lipopolysaccharide/colanic/teichoic acid biosynthesis glycosyltransferase
VIKRAVDLIASIAGLLVLSVLLIAIAVAIKLDSRGPVFFRQVRVGRYGRPFRIHKFRTMIVDAESKGPQLTVGQDARITRVGGCLRRCKLDEFPQLLDVVRGEMSLVGPRPEVPKYVQSYPDSLRAVVLSVRPGITDSASIEFRNETALLGSVADPEAYYREVILPRKLQAYADYARSHTTAGDLIIVWRTVVALVRN